MRQRSRRALSLLLTLCMIAGFFPGGIVITARAAENVSYLDADGATRTAASATEVTSDSTAWESGWYVVNDEVTIGSRVSVTGEVHLILADGAHLTASGGINVGGGNSLTIYAQSTGDGMGKLSATGGNDEAGIGGNSRQSGGAITINGGAVTATGGGYDGAGIGGGYDGASGAITINGGVITATGNRAAGIGSGTYAVVSEITINGGTVTANSNRGAGIGDGYFGNQYDATSGVITINGGSITANGGDAGIGGANDGKKGSINLSWTEATKEEMFVSASSYGGTVTLQKAFCIEGEAAPLNPETISNANEKKSFRVTYTVGAISLPLAIPPLRRLVSTMTAFTITSLTMGQSPKPCKSVYRKVS